MVIALSLCALSFGQLTWAEEQVLDLNPLIVYDKDLHRRSAFPTEIEKAFLARGFVALKGHGGVEASYPLYSVDRIFISEHADPNGQHATAYVLAGMTVKGNVQFGKLYAHPKGVLLHLQPEITGEVAILFENMPISRVTELREAIETEKPRAAEVGHSKFKSSWLNLLAIHLNPTAEAQDLVEDPAKCGATGKARATDSDPSTLKNIWGCTKGFGAGVWDASAGTVWLVAKGIAHVTFRPVQTFTKISAQFHQIQNFVGNFEDSFGELGTAFRALPAEVKWKVGCEIVASLGVTAAIAYFSLGTGSPLVLRQMASALAKVSAAMPKGRSIAGIGALGTQLEAKVKVANQVERLISRGAQGRLFYNATKDYRDLLNQTVFMEAKIRAFAPLRQASINAVAVGDDIGRTVTEAEAKLAGYQARMAEIERKYPYVKTNPATPQQEASWKATAARVQIYREFLATGKTTAEQRLAAKAYLGFSLCQTVDSVMDSVKENSTTDR